MNTCYVLGALLTLSLIFTTTLKFIYYIFLVEKSKAQGVKGQSLNQSNETGLKMEGMPLWAQLQCFLSLYQDASPLGQEGCLPHSLLCPLSLEQYLLNACKNKQIHNNTHPGFGRHASEQWRARVVLAAANHSRLQPRSWGASSPSLISDVGCPWAPHR